ncbi:hypothetical protein IT087_04335 [Candidatus Uhrbacteria bacterium]|nr:hypothetical protein [Candidatus Uhrbacteria bacterium]
MTRRKAGGSMNNVLMSVVALLLVGNVALATWSDTRYDDLVFTTNIQRELPCPELHALAVELRTHRALAEKELSHFDFENGRCI